MPAPLSRKVLHADAAARARASLATITPEENAAITAAARLDPDNPPLFEDEPLDVDGESKSVIFIDADVAERMRAEGPDWQRRANRILREAFGL